jgi:hypothetical protein
LEKNDKQRSEFQDINRNFQRVDESSIGSEEFWMVLLKPGGYSKVLDTIDLIDVHFRQFRPMCLEDEITKMDNSYFDLRKRAVKELQRIENARMYMPEHNPELDEQLLKDIRLYLCECYRLRHEHGLLIRTVKRANINKRVENAVRF